MVMGTIELKSNLHKIVDRIEDEQLLRAIYSFLEKRESSEDGRMWRQLTDKQKKEVLKAYEESDDDANLIDDEDIWKDLK
jgi:DNA-binding MarR family transcriptional regulator